MTEHRHPGAWRVLLPTAPDGPVLLVDLGPRIIADLRMSYPASVALVRRGPTAPAGSVVWDGRRCPIRPGVVGLVVSDDRVPRAAGVLAAVTAPAAARAAVVSSRRRHDYALYPRASDPDALVGRRWPPMSSGPIRTRIGYVIAGTPLWRLLDRDGLVLDRAADSLVSQLVDEVGRRCGTRAELRGVFVGRGRGQLTLRVGAGRRHLAIRLALTPEGRARLRTHDDTARAAMAGPRTFRVPRPLFGADEPWGSWMAEPWVAGRGGPGGLRWAPRGRGWAVAGRVGEELAAVEPAGQAGAGWAQRWVEPLERRTGALDPLVAGELAALESAGVALGRCHGDLWPGNLILRPWVRRPWLIDWERARDDAPLGLDGLHLAVSRAAVRAGVTIPEATAELLPGLAVAQPRSVVVGDQLLVGGREWRAWDVAVQRGLLVAVVVHHLTGASDRAGWERAWIDGQLQRVLASLAGPGSGQARASST